MRASGLRVSGARDVLWRVWVIVAWLVAGAPCGRVWAGAADDGVAARRVEARAGELVDLARRLVRTNTVNPYSGDPPGECGGEGPGQAVIEPLLREIGAVVEKFDCPADIYRASGVLGPRDREFRARPNLVATIAFGGEGPRALLQFHMDTVGVSGMTIEPHSGEVREGRLYGRGSSDCRGGIAAAVMAARVLHELREGLCGSLTLFSVVDEECNGGGAGALACLARKGGRESYDFAICVDGDGPQVTRGFGGVITGELRVRGRGGHAAMPGGVSAIDKAVVVKGALDAFKREREAAQEGARVNLGILRGGVHPAVIPSEALMAFNACTTVRDDSAGVRRRFEAMLRGCEAGDEWLREHPSGLEWVKDLAPYETGADSALVRGVAAVHARVLGSGAEVGLNPAWSDACWLARAGIPTINYGAGTPRQAHGDGEYGELDRIVGTCKVLATYLRERLGR